MALGRRIRRDAVEALEFPKKMREGNLKRPRPVPMLPDLSITTITIVSIPFESALFRETVGQL